jgi:hypothetical protein
MSPDESADYISAKCKRKELCKSLAGNVVDLLEISEDVHSESGSAKASILLSARVHPGETQGSWAIQSCIEFLTSSLPEAKFLRSRFTIYVIPMLNPDGVINGHYRCSMSGQDLNRVWANPDKNKNPCIWHTRDLVRTLSSQGLAFFCDFHGHSVKKNVFMYGCNTAGNQSYKPGSTKAIPTTAMFPLLLDEISPAFSFNDCNFRVQRSKLNTGRVVVNRSVLCVCIFCAFVLVSCVSHTDTRHRHMSYMHTHTNLTHTQTHTH